MLSKRTTPDELAAVLPVNEVFTTPFAGVAVTVKVTSSLAVVRFPNASYSQSTGELWPPITALLVALFVGVVCQTKLAATPGVMLKVFESSAPVVTSVPAISVIWNWIL